MDDNNPIPPGSVGAPLRLSTVFLKLGSNTGAIPSLSQFKLASAMWNPLLPGIGSNLHMAMFGGKRLPDISGVVTAPLTLTGSAFAFATATDTTTLGTDIPVTVTRSSNTHTNAWTITEQATIKDGTGGAFGAVTCNVTILGTPYGVVATATPLMSYVSSNVTFVGTNVGVLVTPTISVLKRNGKTKTMGCTTVTVANNVVVGGAMETVNMAAPTAAYNTANIASAPLAYNAIAYPIAANAYTNTNYNAPTGGANAWYSQNVYDSIGFYDPRRNNPIYSTVNGTNYNSTRQGYVGNVSFSYAGHNQNDGFGYYARHINRNYTVDNYAAGTYKGTTNVAANYNVTPSSVATYNKAGHNTTANYAFNTVTYNTVPTLAAAFNYNTTNAATITLTLGATTRTIAVSKTAAYNIATYP